MSQVKSKKEKGKRMRRDSGLRGKLAMSGIFAFLLLPFAFA